MQGKCIAHALVSEDLTQGYIKIQAMLFTGMTHQLIQHTQSKS